MSDHTPPAPPVAADMREVFSALVGGGPESPDVDGHCSRCGCPIRIPGWIHDIGRAWNRRELRKVKATEQGRFPHRAEYIKASQLIPCGPCEPIVRLEIEAAAIDEHRITGVYYRELRRGTYTAESLAWLRDHGFAREVQEHLAREKETT